MRIIKIAQGVVREAQKTAKRSSHWPKVRDEHLKVFPKCAACGGGLLVQMHHIEPFHEDPTKELDPNNLISLCIYKLCHIEIGHGDDYGYFNPDVVKHAGMVAVGVPRDKVVADAKARRRVNQPPVKS